MTWWHAVVILLAGIWAGSINAVVGSGTLVTFPTLVALGFPPITATTSNAIGLVPGTISGAIGYRKELRGQARRLVIYGAASFAGAIGGAFLLLKLPKDAFETIVPVLVGLAVVLVIVQPKVSAWVAGRDDSRSQDRNRYSVLLLILVGLIGVYGGYFTAAQGVMLVAVMGMMLSDPLQRLNGIKNVLSAIVNVVAGAIYAVVAPVDWTVVGILAVGSTAGGVLGAWIGRKLPPAALRAVIVIVGVAAVIQLVLR